MRYLYEIKPTAPTASNSNVPKTLPTISDVEEELSAKRKNIQMSEFVVKLRRLFKIYLTSQGER